MTGRIGTALLFGTSLLGPILGELTDLVPKPVGIAVGVTLGAAGFAATFLDRRESRGPTLRRHGPGSLGPATGTVRPAKNSQPWSLLLAVLLGATAFVFPWAAVPGLFFAAVAVRAEGFVATALGVVSLIWVVLAGAAGALVAVDQREPAPSPAAMSPEETAALNSYFGELQQRCRTATVTNRDICRFAVDPAAQLLLIDEFGWYECRRADRSPVECADNLPR